MFDKYLVIGTKTITIVSGYEHTLRLAPSLQTFQYSFKIIVTGGFKQMGRARAISIGTVH